MLVADLSQGITYGLLHGRWLPTRGEHRSESAQNRVNAMEQLSPQLMNRLVFAVIMHGLNEAQTAMALNVLTDALKHSNSQIRELAIVALADLPVHVSKRIPPLTLAMKDESSKVRRRAARALGDQGPAAMPALPQLIIGLKDMDASVRRDCAGAVGRLGPAGHPATHSLVPLLSEPEYRTRAIAAVAIKRFGRAAIPGLLDGVCSPDAERRGRCAMLLAKIAPDDEAVAEILGEVLTDEDAELQAKADRALQMICTPPPMEMSELQRY